MGGTKLCLLLLLGTYTLARKYCVFILKLVPFKDFLLWLKCKCKTEVADYDVFNIMSGTKALNVWLCL